MPSTQATQAEFQGAGKALAEPAYLVDQSGNPITSSNPMNVNTLIAGPTATSPYTATVDPETNLRVAMSPTITFFDVFGAASIDTVNWKTPVSSGGGTFTYAQQLITLGTGTTAGGYSVLESVPTFAEGTSGLLLSNTVLSIEYPTLTNGYRFWGCGTHPATPTAAAPLSNAVGFELYTDGKMYCVIYFNGTREVVQDLSAATGNGKQPADFFPHMYAIYLRGDQYRFYIDPGIAEIAVAGTNNAQPNPPITVTLPFKYLAVANTTPPTSTAKINLKSCFMFDTLRESVQLADGIYPFRKATIDSLGNLRTADFIRSSIANGQGFRATTTLLTTNGTNTFAGFLAKVTNLPVNVCIYNVVVSVSVGCPDGRIYYNTTGANTDAGLSLNLLTANTSNQIVGGTASQLSVLSGSPTTVVETTGMGGTGGVLCGSFSVVAGAPFLLFANSSQIILPKNTTQNASVYVNVPTTTQTVSYLIEWIEF